MSRFYSRVLAVNDYLVDSLFAETLQIQVFHSILIVYNLFIWFHLELYTYIYNIVMLYIY